MDTLQQPESVPATAASYPSPKTSKPLLWILSSFIVFILGLGTSYLYLQRRTTQPFSTTPPSTTPKPSETISLSIRAPSSLPTPGESMTKSTELVYIRDNNVYQYNLANKKEAPLTSDGGDFISYKQLVANAKERFSVERCVRSSDREGKKPYSCAIILYKAGATIPLELVTRSSRANVNGYHVGGEFGPFAVSSDGKLLVYVQTQDIDTTKATVEIHSRRLDDKNDELLMALSIRTGGRGGSLDDDVGIYFSPDQTKFVVNLTTLYPQQGAEDQGTMFVFDLPTKKLLWKQANQWTTSGRFLDNQTVVAKQQPGNGGQANLITIAVASGTVSTLGNFAGYGITPLNKGTILYFRDQAESGKGMVLEKLDLTTNQKTMVRENVLPMGSWVADSIAVRTMKPCTPESCGMDFYNGYETDGLALLDIASRTITPLPISSAASDFSLR